jgi:hypothetical protein
MRYTISDRPCSTARKVAPLSRFAKAICRTGISSTLLPRRDAVTYRLSAVLGCIGMADNDPLMILFLRLERYGALPMFPRRFPRSSWNSFPIRPA